jgi:hypothetical protein
MSLFTDCHGYVVPRASAATALMHYSVMSYNGRQSSQVLASVLVRARHIQADSDVICVRDTADMHFPVYSLFNKTTQYLFMQWQCYRPLFWETSQTNLRTVKVLGLYLRCSRFESSVDNSYPDPDISWFSLSFQSNTGILS